MFRVLRPAACAYVLKRFCIQRFFKGFVRDGCKKVSQAISDLKTMGCRITFLWYLLLKAAVVCDKCPKKVLQSHTQNSLILRIQNRTYQLTEKAHFSGRLLL
jgi:hypothetical protein